jgi:acetyl-CoA carboxylase beta subunit
MENQKRCGTYWSWKIKGREVVICCMDFAFIGGSMGAVVGEKISRGFNLYQNKIHL